MSHGSPEADWDPPPDELNFPQMNSRSEPEACHRELRAPDRGAARLTALAGCLAAVAECFPEASDAEWEQVVEAACYQDPDAAWEQASNAEQASKAVEACCWDPDAARDSNTPNSRLDKARAGSPRILSSASPALHLLFSGFIRRNGLRQFR
jgi:hypothetical protein